MNNNYEVVFSVRPDVADDAIKGIIQKVKEAVEGLSGRVNRVDEWGKRKMAFQIKKYSEGYYIFVDISSPPAASKEVERILRLNGDVIRYQPEKKPAERVVKEK